MTNCVLCDRWQQTPYAKRHTTPTTAQDTEGALVLGFHLARSLEGTAPRICPRHSALLFQLDAIVEANARALEAPAVPTQQQIDFQARADAVVAQLTRPQAPAPAPPLPDASVLLTPATIPAPPPVEVPVMNPVHSSQLVAPIPPAESKPTFPCPICQRPAVAGELHRCE
jgi:hypothetical protein